MSALIVLALASTAAAWGTLGHETVALIAQNYISSDTVTFCQNILDDTSDTYLANVATWADSYRYTKAGSYSQPYHFIDAEDNPPTSCNVDYDRDCGSGGCVVSALANYVSKHTQIKSVTLTCAFVDRTGQRLFALLFPGAGRVKIHYPRTLMNYPSLRTKTYHC